MTTQIHPTAIVEDGAQLGKNVKIGPYCCVGSNVQLGDKVELMSHVAVAGQTKIGEECVIYPFASIGHKPQDRKFHGEGSSLEIGKNNIIREYATIQPGTEGGGMITRVGNDCLLMASIHIAHDCVVGNGVVMANNATLAGHVIVGDNATIGGLAAIHQFVRIGQHAMISGMSGIKSDVIPYGLVMTRQAYLSGVNLVGLKRRGFNQKSIKALREAYRDIFVEELDVKALSLSERVEEAAKTFKESDEVSEIVNFIRESTSRPLLQPNS